MAEKRRNQKQGRKEKPVRYFDYSLLFLIIFILCFGLIMLYSTSSYSGFDKMGDAAYYVKGQILKGMIPGLAAMIVISRIPYHVWLKFSVFAYTAALILCTAVIFVGDEAKGQARWLAIGPIRFQPSELAKVGIILMYATVLYKTPAKAYQDKLCLFKLLIPMLPMFAVVAYNNLSTAIIIAGIAVCMLFVASPKYLQFFKVAVVLVVAGVLFIVMASYRAERIMIWLHPEDYAKGYQTLQGLYAIGSGGLFGRGLGESMQKLGFIPEAQNDMIFAVICEELGLFGAVSLILLYLLLIWRLMIIANNAADLYGALLVVGIMAHISIQVLLNIAVVTNSMPNTGVSLPFISYGGTALAILLAELGLALSVSRGIKLDGT